MQEKKPPLLILGHGEMGQAMEFLLAARQPLRIWQRHPPAGEAAVNLEALVPDSDILLFCLPATAHAAVAAQIAPLLPAEALCLTIAKGLDERGRLPAAVLTEAVGATRAAVFAVCIATNPARAIRPT